MAGVHESIYPRFKSVFSERELMEIYTPSQEESEFAKRVTTKLQTRICFLITLKCFQKLGYFVPTSKIPEEIVSHISKVTKIFISNNQIKEYNNSATRERHIQEIRKYLSAKPYNADARHLLVQTIGKSALTKDEPLDLINLAIEELIKNCYELPAFTTLNKAAVRIRGSVNRAYYREIFNSLSREFIEKTDKIVESAEDLTYTDWNKLKKESLSPTVNHLKEVVAQLTWLKEFEPATSSLKNIPYVKIKQFALEAKTMDANKLKEIEPYKRYALISSLIYIQSMSTTDDIAEMFIKRMMHIHKRGRDALELYRKEHIQVTDKLVLTLRDLIEAYQKDGTVKERFSAIDSILSKQSDDMLEKCELHVAHSGNNYYSFLWRYYKSHRVVLFDILKKVKMYSTNQDLSIEEAYKFLQLNENKRSEWIDTVKIENKGTPDESSVELLKLNWISDSWWKQVTGKNSRELYPEKINRRQFEICLFTQIMWELKSGDLYIEGGDKYSDYREQLISWEDYEKGKEIFGEQVNLPVESSEFIASLKSMMHKAISETDKSFPENRYVKIVNGEPHISKIEKIKYPEQKKKIDSLIAERLKHVNILDIITDTEYWLNWSKHFGLLSGHESKIEDPKARYILSTFCYGCNLGPTQTVRSLEELTRKHISKINRSHITEEKLDKSIFHVINGYNSLLLPKYWGTGDSSSTDGTKWEVYEQNLLSEYHIRYGGYGGIGYYHVSDKYIALFSHFIPCGTWEGVYLLDILQNNRSEIQPNTIHGDTQSQNGPIFGLSYLLGINLMPRIRNWKDLTLYRPDNTNKYKHIDEIFSDTINWDLIEKYFPDMLRVALSIKDGKITPSTILKKLGTYSRKNKLYQAFRELGRVIRTAYLMKYIKDVELRSTIQAATNKSEAFNGFAKWIAFGNDGIIRENSREEQRKIIKYNHLVANCLIFYNTCMLTHIIEDLINEGYVIEKETLASLSPYITHHINRFGKYKLDLDRKPQDILYEFSI